LPRVIIVDDDRAVLRSVAKVMHLRLPDWQVTITNSASAVLSAIGRRSFDVLVTELELADVNGLELLRVAERIDPGMVRVAHSGCVQRFAEARRLAFRLLPKPAVPEELARTLEEALAHRNAHPWHRRRA
jgi:DNA-binding NtrC family response regulator